MWCGLGACLCVCVCVCVLALSAHCGCLPAFFLESLSQSVSPHLSAAYIHTHPSRRTAYIHEIEKYLMGVCGCCCCGCCCVGCVGCVVWYGITYVSGAKNLRKDR